MANLMINIMITDAELIKKIKSFKPEFGNEGHISINKMIGKLKSLLKQKETPAVRADIELLKKNIVFNIDGK